MLTVMIGGGFGAVCRFLISKWLLSVTELPWPTFIINCAGSFLLGLVLQLPEAWHLLLATGFLGAFTTFSTYSYEALQLVLAKKITQAALYVSGSLVCSLVSFYFATLLL